MGLFDYIDDILVDPYLYVLTGGNASSENVYDAFRGGEEVPSVQGYSEDQKTTYLKALQKKVAGDFRAGMDTTLAQGKGLINAQGQQKLDEQNRGTDRAANQRGLYFSGKREASRAGNAADVAGQVGEQSGNFETSVRDQARSLDSDVIDNEIQSSFNDSSLRGLNQNQYADNLYKALNKKVKKQAAMGELGEGAGKVAGTYAGGGF